MTHNDFEEYKKAIKSKYDIEKAGAFSSFLWSPSRANLRKLCTERFKGNKSIDDLATYRVLFGYDFEDGNRNKLMKETGRFRSIENFFKGITDTNDIEVINLAAILVDFTPRPFRKFSRNQEQVLTDSEENIIENGDQTNEDKNGNDDVKNKRSFIKKFSFVILVLLGISTVSYTAINLISPKKQCMQWQQDHYERMDCQSEINKLYSDAPIIPFDEDLYELNKLTVTDTTTFFKGGKPIVWYCKMDTETVECFDDPGFHPITGKALRPITNYIIGKYLLKN